MRAAGVAADAQRLALPHRAVACLEPHKRMSDLVEDNIPHFALFIEFSELATEADVPLAVLAQTETYYGVVELKGPVVEAVLIHELASEAVCVVGVHIARLQHYRLAVKLRLGCLDQGEDAD